MSQNATSIGVGITVPVGGILKKTAVQQKPPVPQQRIVIDLEDGDHKDDEDINSSVDFMRSIGWLGPDEEPPASLLPKPTPLTSAPPSNTTTNNFNSNNSNQSHSSGPLSGASRQRYQSSH